MALTNAKHETYAQDSSIEQLKAENQKLRNLVIEKELELDALLQRLNCVIDGSTPVALSA